MLELDELFRNQRALLKVNLKKGDILSKDE